MTEHYDLIILGTGPSASRIAKRCAGSLKVAIVEAREVGGECALRGCNPKKVFVRAAELLDAVKRSDGKLIKSGSAAIDWPQLVAFKDTFTDPIPKKSRNSYEKRGIRVVDGYGRFVSRNEIAVGNMVLSADKFAICTGAKPVPLNVPGEELVTKSDEFMDLKALPDSIVFIGGGYISFEFAHIARRFGRTVTIVDRNPSPLGTFDTELVEKLVAHSRDIGIDVITEADVQAVRRTQDSLLSIAVDHKGDSISLAAELVVHGAGRVPNVSELNLDAADVRFTDAGICVNEFLQSETNPNVFAAGDVVCSDQPMLTPVANQQGYTVAKNILDGASHSPDYGPVPQVVFTIPSMASIGLTEQAAADAGVDVEIQTGDRSDSGSVRKVCGSCAWFKVLFDRSDKRIVGAHLCGPEAAEMINVFAVAMKAGMTRTDLKSVLMAFPTFTSDIRQMM